MKLDNQGFQYPYINTETCIKCGLCDNVCPIINSGKRNLTYQKIYAARTKYDDILMRSSSGGIFYMFASYVISSLNGLVIGVEYDGNMVVRHAVTDTLDGLKRFHGSKYVQSQTEGIFEIVKKYLDNGRFVLFSGTPCQVHALRLYLRKDYDNLLTMDLVCHSVPSPSFFKEYVDFVEKKIQKKLVSIDMRSKKNGWSHKFYYSYHFADGTVIGDESLPVEHWGKLFFSGYLTRPSCNQCHFANLKRPGDVTIADYWDDSNKRPDIYYDKGTSLVIINSHKGKNVFDSISSIVYSWEISEREAMQPCLQHPTNANPNRDDFWMFYNKYGFDATYKRYFIDHWYLKGYRFVRKCVGKTFRKLGLKK